MWASPRRGKPPAHGVIRSVTVFSNDELEDLGINAKPAEKKGEGQFGEKGETKINFYTLAGLETDNGTVVIGRSGDFGGPRDYFFRRNHTEYILGFGDREKDFWIGTEPLYQLTKAGDKKLRVELVEDGKSAWAEYDNFIIEKVYWSPGYRPSSSGFTGNETVSWSCTRSNCMNGCYSFRVFKPINPGRMTDLYGYLNYDRARIKNSTMWIMNK